MQLPLKFCNSRFEPSSYYDCAVQILDTIAELQERHDAVREIEKKLLELHQVSLSNSFQYHRLSEESYY